MFVKHLALFVCVFIRINRGTNVDNLIVELVEPKGKIQGHILESAKGREYYAFQQIPYGKPPVGEKRFRHPELHDGWDGILDCTKNTKICYQFTFPMNAIENGLQNLSKSTNTEMEESEDCLYLNVYSPVKPGTNHSLSVYINIHGGAFATGDGTIHSFGPKYLIDGDIIIVTMNYRLGALGFLSTQDDVISGNMGLKDQHLAIKWTHENIHLFGGNPRDIVLGGESAGAYSTGYHLLSPKTEGLVSGFIQQSGSHIGVAAFSQQPRKLAFELGRALMKHLVPENTCSLVHALKNASPEDIVRASDSVQFPELWGFITGIIWEPVKESCDDYGAFICSPMHEDMIQGNFNRVPCLIGFNSEESLGFMSPDESALERAAALFDANPSLLINLAIDVDNRTLAGEKLKETYTSSSFLEDLGAFIKDDLIVELVKPNGKIRGHVLESAKGREYYAFQQIPYGKPPIGENRFRPPELHDDWDGILDCTENTKICYQFDYNLIRNNLQKSLKNLREINGIEESEDCLYVNVYTPVKPGSSDSLSVFLFIHGGAFVSGDGTFSTYGPKYLIDGDIVIVTMNYRLGPLGFLSTGDSVISGNMGLKDQHLALKWTYENIHLFGGNPQDIVLGGESAGSFSVGHHLISPRTKGLVSGFIQQSGSPLSFNSISFEPRKYALELARELDPTISENTDSFVDALKKASPEDLVKASLLTDSPVPSGFIAAITWTPVIEDVDSSQAFLTSPIYEEMMKGKFNQVPSFIGFNSEESLMFLPSSESILKKAATQHDVDPSLLINPTFNVENRTMVGEKLKEIYTASSFEKDLEAFIRFTSDLVFTRSSIRQAELTSEHVPVYLYQLSSAININDKYPGVAHALDLWYFWEIADFPLYKIIVDEDVREIVLRLWWNFIKYKNPTPVKDPVLQNIEWPTVEQENLNYLNLNRTLSIETNPRNYENLKKVLLEYMMPPFYVF